MQRLTPYDTGARLEPRLWPVATLRQTGIRRETGDPESHYGKVDFDNDFGETVFTAWVEQTPGGYTLVVDQYGPQVLSICIRDE